MPAGLRSGGHVFTCYLQASKFEQESAKSFQQIVVIVLLALAKFSTVDRLDSTSEADGVDGPCRGSRWIGALEKRVLHSVQNDKVEGGTGGSKSRFPSGMTERKAKAKASPALLRGFFATCYFLLALVTDCFLLATYGSRCLFPTLLEVRH
jgi:hypothetical protein